MKLYGIALLLMMHTCEYAMLITLPKITRIPALALQRSSYHQSAHIAALVERYHQNNERLYDLESLGTRLYSKLNKQTYDNATSFNRIHKKIFGTIEEINDLTIVNMVLDKQILTLTQEEQLAALQEEYYKNNDELYKLKLEHIRLCVKHNEQSHMWVKSYGYPCEIYHKMLSNRTYVKIYRIIDENTRLNALNSDIYQKILKLNNDAEMVPDQKTKTEVDRPKRIFVPYPHDD